MVILIHHYSSSKFFGPRLLCLPPWFDNQNKPIFLFQSFHVWKLQGTRMYECIWMRLDSYAFLSIHVENKLIETCSSKKEKSQPLNFLKFRPLQKKHPEVEKVSDSNPFCEQPNRDFNHPWIRVEISTSLWPERPGQQVVGSSHDGVKAISQCPDRCCQCVPSYLNER